MTSIGVADRSETFPRRSATASIDSRQARPNDLIVDRVEFIEGDVVEAAQKEERVDGAGPRDRDTGDHADHHFGDREDDAPA